MLSEKDFEMKDMYMTQEGRGYPHLSDKDLKIWKTYIMDFQTAAKTLDPALATQLEEAYSSFMGIAESINMILYDFNQIKKPLTKNYTYPQLCNALESQPAVLHMMLRTCEVLLSDPSKVKPNASKGINFMFYTMLKVDQLLGTILNAYEAKRTTAQRLKNIAGGLKSKYDWLHHKLFDLYKYRTETVMKLYAAVKCVPRDLSDIDFDKSLLPYDQELEDLFEEAKQEYEEFKKPKSMYSLQPTPTRLGYTVPGRGSLMKLKRGYNEDWYFQPQEEGNTGGPATPANIGAYYKSVSNRRAAEEQGSSRSYLTAPPPPPPRSTLPRTLTATPAEIEEIGRRIRAPEQGLAAIKEENENESNQEGGRKKTRKARKGKKGTRRR